MTNQLPPLPAKSELRQLSSQYIAEPPYIVWGYTADQMAAYGAQCAEQAAGRERARCAAVCYYVAESELARRQHYASSIATVCATGIERGVK